MNLIVKTPRLALWGDRQFRCAIGRNGVAAMTDMYEGGGKTPLGLWPMREVFYRPDRISAPQTVLPLRRMQSTDAWCDVVGDPKYNQHVQLPYPTREEKLWREDHVYDILVVMGYNDAPVEQGKGSAIFLHIARPDFAPSAGCVTLALDDLLTVLREADTNSCVEILSL